MAKHLTVVTFTKRIRDWFKTRYWVNCWCCDFREGPFLDEKDAQDFRAVADKMPCSNIHYVARYWEDIQ